MFFLPPKNLFNTNQLILRKLKLRKERKQKKAKKIKEKFKTKNLKNNKIIFSFFFGKFGKLWMRSFREQVFLFCIFMKLVEL